MKNVILNSLKITLILCEISLCFLSFSQEMNPYLQTPTSSSIWVTWLSNSGTESTVEYGTSQNNLDKTISGTSIHMANDEDNFNWHKVHLTGLSANTPYYYKIKTGNKVSEIKRFKTQPIEGTSSGHYRFIVMGDHQARGERYRTLVSQARKKAEEKFGSPLEDHINLIVNVGDQVDQGFRLKDWRDVHFGLGAPITGNLPSITVVGNGLMEKKKI